nr:immunoglobulin light chain junction region [Macaca mulatta]MOW31402.1 immunoglobulin light chain junction region [Macaca mulatta]MOW31458.1 immunoglobulin light chain junction region [Macaca mulatta]
DYYCQSYDSFLSGHFF